MADTEIIQEDAAILQLLEELNNGRFPVHVALLNGDFSGITHVTGIRHRRKAAFFRVEHAESFANAVGKSKEWKSWFEFYGKDNIQYAFRTTGWKISHDGIWHNFPEFIERKQRRKYFRLDIPQKIDMFLIVGAGRYKMSAIDISIGGIFVEFVAGGEMPKADPPWRIGDRVAELALETRFDCVSYRINIQEGVVRRSEKESSAEKYKYAFEFTKMTKSEENALVDLVYELQRKILKERIKINA